MLIGIVGLNGSGKDSVAEYLVDKYHFAHKDLGQEIRQELKALGRNYLDRNEMIALGNEMRQKYGYNYWCKRAIESVASSDIVITSIRNPSEAEEIKSRGGKIIGISANLNVRFQRTIQRVKDNPDGNTKHGDIKSFDDFQAKERKELESNDPSKQQLLKCIAMADYTIDNNGDIKQLYGIVEETLSRLDYK